MLTLTSIRMPKLAEVGRPSQLSRAEWEKLSRLCATVEADGATKLMGSWKGRGGPALAATLRREIEEYVQAAMRKEGFDLDEWIILAGPEARMDLTRWGVVLLCQREDREPAGTAVEADHAPTISEKTEAVPYQCPEAKGSHCLCYFRTFGCEAKDTRRVGVCCACGAKSEVGPAIIPMDFDKPEVKEAIRESTREHLATYGIERPLREEVADKTAMAMSPDEVKAYMEERVNAPRPEGHLTSIAEGEMASRLKGNPPRLQIVEDGVLWPMPDLPQGESITPPVSLDLWKNTRERLVREGRSEDFIRETFMALEVAWGRLRVPLHVTVVISPMPATLLEREGEILPVAMETKTLSLMAKPFFDGDRLAADLQEWFDRIEEPSAVVLYQAPIPCGEPYGEPPELLPWRFRARVVEGKGWRLAGPRAMPPAAAVAGPRNVAPPDPIGWAEAMTRAKSEEVRAVTDMLNRNNPPIRAEGAPCGRYVEGVPYNLECVLEPDHEGPCHAHVWGEDGRCWLDTCAVMRDDEDSEVGKEGIAQVVRAIQAWPLDRKAAGRDLVSAVEAAAEVAALELHGGERYVQVTWEAWTALLAARRTFVDVDRAMGRIERRTRRYIEGFNLTEPWTDVTFELVTESPDGSRTRLRATDARPARITPSTVAFEAREIEPLEGLPPTVPSCFRPAVDRDGMPEELLSWCLGWEGKEGVEVVHHEPTLAERIERADHLIAAADGPEAWMAVGQDFMQVAHDIRQPESVRSLAGVVYALAMTIAQDMVSWPEEAGALYDDGFGDAKTAAGDILTNERDALLRADRMGEANVVEKILELVDALEPDDEEEDGEGEAPETLH